MPTFDNWEPHTEMNRSKTNCYDVI